jgi:hypothetical protein
MGGFNLSIMMPIIALTLLLVACVMAWRFKVKSFKQSHFSIFIDMLAPIGIIMIGISIYTDAVQLELEKQMDKFQLYKDRVENLYNIPMDTLVETPNIRMKFSTSFFCNNPRLHELTAQDQTPETAASELAEQYVSMKILQVFEDFLSYETVNDFEDPAWLGIFMQWAQSKYLQKHVPLLKHLYADETIAFTALLVEYANEIPCPNTDPKLYVSLSDVMYRDPRLKEIHESMLKEKF